MAHTALHFSLGMAIGSATLLPAVAKAWRAGRPVAGAVGRWLAGAYALGVYAVVPSLLGWVGLPPALCSGWWMNVFLLHPLINRFARGGMIAAGAAIIVCFALPYAVLLLGIRRAGRPVGTEAKV